MNILNQNKISVMKYVINRDCIELLDSNLLNKLDVLEDFENELFSDLKKRIDNFDTIFNMDINILKYDENFKAATYINSIKIFIKKLIDLNEDINSIILNELEYDILFNFSNLLDQQKTLYNNQVIRYIKKEID